MSRSYKKTPIVKDHTKGMKQLANRKVRRQKDVPQFAGYKKLFCSYDICDWVFRESFEEYLSRERRTEKEWNIKPWFKEDRIKTDKEHYNDWAKSYKRK